MTNTTIATQEPDLKTPTLATEKEVIQYLRYSNKFADISALAKEDALLVKLCKQFDLQVSDEELQAAGDAFRLKHKLLGIKETQDWLRQRGISVEDWSEGIKLQLLKNKLKEHLFGVNVDRHYIDNREQYRRVALSQILVLDREKALSIMRSLQEENTSFCALALEHSEDSQSRVNGGFVGIRYLTELMPEIVQGITDKPVGVIIEPIQTKLGYCILRVEKWFPPKLDESFREQMMSSLWQFWLREQQS